MTETINSKGPLGKDETARGLHEEPLRNFFHEPFTRVPAPYIGKIANGEKTAAPALHLIAYKLSRGGNWVLNIIDVVFKRKLMGKHHFEIGLKHIKATGVMVRHQPNHRDFASETLSPVQTGCYCVSINDAVILTSRSATVAFILAANVSPTPRTPAEIAAKIGIKSRDTTRKVLAECVRHKAVEVYHDTFGRTWVCRPGEAPTRGVAKNQGAKNQATKNRGAQRNKREDQRIREKNKKTGNAYVAAEAARCPDLDVLSLPDWRKHPDIQALTEDGHVDLWMDAPIVPASQIGALLRYHGADAPAHLIRPQGVQQICALAAVARAYQTEDVDFESALDAVCNRIARAIMGGATIRSLAFVALPVLKAVHNDGYWATHYQSNRLGDAQPKWQAWAEDALIPALNNAGVPTDDRALTSTRQLEALAALHQEHGQARIEAACRFASIAEGKQVCGWRFVVGYLPKLHGKAV